MHTPRFRTALAALAAVVLLAAAPLVATEYTLVPYSAKELMEGRPAVEGYLYKIVAREAEPGFEAPGFDALLAGFQEGAAPFASTSSNGCGLFEYLQTIWEPTDTDILVRFNLRLCDRISNVRVALAIDNDARVWVNGVPAVPVACPVISPDGLCMTEYCAAFDKLVFNVPNEALVNGENVFAIRARDRHVVSFLDIEVKADFADEGEALRFLSTGELPCTFDEPPVCDNAAASVDQIWPPNHKFRAVNVEGVTDPEGGLVDITIDSIFQDEPTLTPGSGNTCVDGEGIGTDTAWVRAERAGTPRLPGDGRVYHINFTATDAEGGTCSGSVPVCVPHDQRPGATCIDQGPLYDSTICQ